MIIAPQADKSGQIDPYGVIVEYAGDGSIADISHGGLSYEEILEIAEGNCPNGYGIVLTGRIDHNRPDWLHTKLPGFPDITDSPSGTDLPTN